MSRPDDHLRGFEFDEDFDLPDYLNRAINRIVNKRISTFFEWLREEPPRLFLEFDEYGPYIEVWFHAFNRETTLEERRKGTRHDMITNIMRVTPIRRELGELIINAIDGEGKSPDELRSLLKQLKAATLKAEEELKYAEDEAQSETEQ